ncbi:MAG: hypothetical protein AAFX85_12170, partial [Pseudomonadota bacterium]
DIAWIRAGLAHPANVICARNTQCPRGTPCQGNRPQQPRPLLEQVREEILKEVHRDGGGR